MHRETSKRVAEASGEQSRRAPLHIVDARHATILSLQRTAGNRAVGNLIKQREDSIAKAAKVSLARAAKPDAADVKSAQVRRKLAEPLARVKAKELITRAKEVEPRVTRIVEELARNRRGRLKGLDHKIKGEDSLVRKIRDGAVERGLAPAEGVEQEAAGINDALRYTIILQPNESYGHLFAEISDMMKLRGIKTNVKKDFWVKSKTYHGVNMTFRTPETPDTPSFGFEVQLHTDASFATKELNHHEYEEERLPTTSPEKKNELNAVMEGRWGEVAVPEGFTPPETRGRREKSGPALTRPRR